MPSAPACTNLSVFPECRMLSVPWDWHGWQCSPFFCSVRVCTAYSYWWIWSPLAVCLHLLSSGSSLLWISIAYATGLLSSLSRAVFSFCRRDASADLTRTFRHFWSPSLPWYFLFPVSRAAKSPSTTDNTDVWMFLWLLHTVRSPTEQLRPCYSYPSWLKYCLDVGHNAQIQIQKSDLKIHPLVLSQCFWYSN